MHGSGQWEHREPYPPERQQSLNPTAARSGSAAARYVASVQTVHAELQGLCAPVPLGHLILAVSPSLGRLPLQGYSKAALRTNTWPLQQTRTHTQHLSNGCSLVWTEGFWSEKWMAGFLHMHSFNHARYVITLPETDVNASSGN